MLRFITAAGLCAASLLLVTAFVPPLTFPRHSSFSSWQHGPLQATATNNIDFDALQNQHVLVVGGSGRVDGSVVTQLAKRGARVTVGGRSFANFAASLGRWQEQFPELGLAVNYCELNREKVDLVEDVLKQQSSDRNPFQLVVNTAGPFQGKVSTPNGVLDAAIRQKVPYIDVCDDYCTASAYKTQYASADVEKNTPCIISTGCWPGVSSLMALQLVRQTLAAFPKLTAEDLSVDFSFFTAGSGGAGITLLVATFLILAEQALTVVKGRRRTVQPMKDYSQVNFGKIVGERSVAPLNLLETASVHDNLGVGSTCSRFGTAPDFWNALLGFMAQLPSSVLANEDLMRKLSVFSIPIVRIVDYFAGATNAMRCDVTSDKEPGLCATTIYAHENLEPCVGECIVAFACAVLADKVRPGVWFPEEAIQAGEDAASVLGLASVSAHTVEVESKGFDLNFSDVWGERVDRQSEVAVNR